MLLLFSFAHGIRNTPLQRVYSAYRRYRGRGSAPRSSTLDLLDVCTFPTLSQVWIVTSADDTTLGRPLSGTNRRCR